MEANDVDSPFAGFAVDGDDLGEGHPRRVMALCLFGIRERTPGLTRDPA